MRSDHLLTFLNSGFSTEGDMDKVLLVGPIAPATYFWIPTKWTFYINDQSGHFESLNQTDVGCVNRLTQLSKHDNSTSI